MNEPMDPAIKAIVEDLVRSWRSPIICRGELPKATGGAMTARHQANLDSNKDVPTPRKILIGGKVCYDRREYFQWLAGRMSIKVANTKSGGADDGGNIENQGATSRGPQHKENTNIEVA